MYNENKMKKFIMSVLLSAMLPTVASAEFKSVPELSVSYETDGVSLLDGKYYFTTVECVNGSDAKFTIYNRDLTVMKEFTIYGVSANLQEDEHISFGETDVCYSEKNDDVDLLCTQKLFNTDDKIEILIATAKNDYTVWDYKIYSEDGSYLGSLSTLIPDLDLNSGAVMYVYEADEARDKLYLAFEIYSSDSWGMKFYSFTNGSGVESPKLLRSISKAYPNPLPSGRSLTIDFATLMTSAGYVQVTDLSGAVVYRAEVEAGSDSVNVPARCLRGGTYVYSVYSNGSVIDSGKILTK